MTNWTHEIWPEEEPGDGAIEFEKLSVGAWIDLQIIHEANGRFYVQATDDWDGEIDIGTADDLDAAKRLAEKWALDQVAEMLKDLGAEGIWLIRGAAGAMLAYTAPDGEGELQYAPALTLERPHERILLVRFPTGDGGEGGIEYYG